MQSGPFYCSLTIQRYATGSNTNSRFEALQSESEHASQPSLHVNVSGLEYEALMFFGLLGVHIYVIVYRIVQFECSTDMHDAHQKVVTVQELVHRSARDCPVI